MNYLKICATQFPTVLQWAIRSNIASHEYRDNSFLFLIICGSELISRNVLNDYTILQLPFSKSFWPADFEDRHGRNPMELFLSNPQVNFAPFSSVGLSTHTTIAPEKLSIFIKLKRNNVRIKSRYTCEPRCVSTTFCRIY